MKVMVAADLLCFIHVDTDTGQVLDAFIHTLPENVTVAQDADVLAIDAEQEENVTPEIETKARQIAHGIGARYFKIEYPQNVVAK